MATDGQAMGGLGELRLEDHLRAATGDLRPARAKAKAAAAPIIATPMMIVSRALDMPCHLPV